MRVRKTDVRQSVFLEKDGLFFVLGEMKEAIHFDSYKSIPSFEKYTLALVNYEIVLQNVRLTKKYLSRILEDAIEVFDCYYKVYITKKVVVCLCTTVNQKL